LWTNILDYVEEYSEIMKNSEYNASIVEVKKAEAKTLEEFKAGCKSILEAVERSQYLIDLEKENDKQRNFKTNSRNNRR
jgi:hypothetical protein